MYLRLKDRFRPIACDDHWRLFDNHTNLEYLLEEDQYDLILTLGGTKTQKQIINDFEEKSKPKVKRFLRELWAIQALEETTVSKKRVFPKNYPNPYLESVLWDITSYCNLQCKHCYVGDSAEESGGKDLSFEEICQVIDEMSSMNIKEVSLTGGEPLMRKDLEEIIRHIMNSNVRLGALFTNGINLPWDFLEFLKCSIPHPEKFCIRMSLDGMTPASNGALRNNGKGTNRIFYQIIDSIKKFVKAGFFVSVATSVHRFNVEEITEMYAFMKKLGVSKWRLAVPKPIGRFQRTQKFIGPNWDKVLESYQRLIERHLRETEIRNHEIFTPLYIGIEQVFYTEMLTQPINLFQEEDRVCFYHKNHCSIKANGNVVPCGYFDNIIGGNVKRVGLKKSWENTIMQQAKKIRVCEITGCQGCKILHLCGAGCRAVAKRVHGNINEKDPYACRQFWFLKETVIPLIEKYGFKMRFSEKCSEFSVALKAD